MPKLAPLRDNKAEREKKRGREGNHGLIPGQLMVTGGGGDWFGVKPFQVFFKFK